MQVTLCNRNHPEYGVATIPLPIPNEEYDNCMELLEKLEIGDVTAHDCYLDQIADAPISLHFLEGTMINVDELDYLARSLDRYTDMEMAQFQCMVATRENWDVQTLINLSFSCDTVTVITDFSRLDEVGKDHYIAMRGGAIPSEEYKQLNGFGIARALIAEGEGKITPYGVLFENGMHIEPIYDGNSFPTYSDQSYWMELALKSPQDGEVSFFLPQPEKRLERLLERGRIVQPVIMDIKTWDCDFPDAIMDRLDISHESVYELNKLCAAIWEMDEAQLKKLSAVVIYTDPEYAFEMRHLAENLDQFDFIPGIRSAEEYGKYMIRESGHFEYDENLEDFYDYTKYGQQRLDKECGEFNELGYISYHGVLSLEELMIEERPALPEPDLRQDMGMQMGGMT